MTWLADTGGNEIGHWVVIRSGGGEPVDLSPGLAPYASEQIAFSRYGGRVGFITASDDRLAVRVATIGADGDIGELRTVHHSTADLTSLAISADGRVAAFSSAHRSTGLEHSILTADTELGEPGLELWDGPGTGIQVHAFAPGRDDRRLTATTNASGRERVFVWDAASGARQDLPPDAPGGDILPLDWSPDGTEVLLCRIDQAEQRLLVWNLASDAIRTLDHPTGAVLSYLRFMASYFRPDGREIVCRWEDFGQPRRLIGLDPQTGRQTRTILASGDVPPGLPVPQRVLPDHRWDGAAPGVARRAGRRRPVPGDPRDARRPDRRHVPQFPRAGAGVHRRRLRVPVAQLPRVDDVRPRVRARDLGPAGRARDRGHGGRPDLADRQRDRDRRPDPAHRLVVRRVPDAAGPRAPAGPVGGRHGRHRDRRLGHELRGLERPPALVPADAVQRRTRGARRGDARGVAADLRRRRPGTRADHPGPQRHADAGTADRALRGAARGTRAPGRDRMVRRGPHGRRRRAVDPPPGADARLRVASARRCSGEPPSDAAPAVRRRDGRRRRGARGRPRARRATATRSP